jgi:lipoprotein-releasing system permease protein
MSSPPEHVVDVDRTSRTRAWVEIVLGLVLLLGGIGVTWWTFDKVEASGGYFVLAYGPIMAGGAIAIHGLFRITAYKSFVALRYLLVPEPKVTSTTKLMIVIGFGALLISEGLFAAGIGDATIWNPLLMIRAAAGVFLLLVVVIGVLRYSKPSLIMWILGMVLGCASLGVQVLVAINGLPLVDLSDDTARSVLQVVNITGLVGFGLAGLAVYIGALRAFFTFFTTVPIIGVWTGTSALVCVLAVMSGFESDLRDKILGSNAHIQITREDGEFVDWRAAKAKIDKIPGVVASTPFAVSEVVIAANNNGMNVIIKGIDPETVGKVTDIISDLEDPDAIRRMKPLIDATQDRTVPQTQRPTSTVDPMPDDMPTSTDPIDFSGGSDADHPDDDAGSAGSNSGSAGSNSAGSNSAGSNSAGSNSAGSGSAHKAGSAVTGPAGDPDIEPVTPYDGDATRIIDGTPHPLGDPGANPLVTSDLVRWFVGDDDDLPSDTAVHVVDMPLEPSLSRRTQALPGILVGRELVKQTHLYTGEEVRVVSPLSDPSNPDATGTPIPFNRDYRVAGIFYTGMYEYDLKYVYVTLDSLQDFLDRGESVDGIEVRITDPDATGRYVPTDDGPGLIRETLGPGYRIQDWRELNRSLFSALKLEKIAMFLVLGIVILVASFSIVGNLIMVVVEKGREIALLKTLGASDTGVMQLFAIQGLLIGLIGTALGIATGLLGCWAGKRFGLPLNPDVYYIDRLPIHVDPQSVAAAAAAGVLISIAATLYPALLAARVRPAAGMRH